jgi:hypothetical protein
MTSSWVQTCFLRLDPRGTTQREDCPPGGLDSNKFDAMEDMFHIQVKDKLFDEDWLKSFATEIHDAKHEKADLVEAMKGLTHLNAHQKADLLWVLQENKKMFDETLDVYSHKKVLIDIDPNAKSVHFMPYPVPQIYLKTFKKEFNHLVGLGVLDLNLPETSHSDQNPLKYAHIRELQQQDKQLLALQVNNSDN